MSTENENCIWIGIGTNLKDGPLCDSIKDANNLLVKEYNAKSGFAGSEYPHLNLYDLGVPTDSIDSISKILKEIVADQGSFTLKTGAINYFPFGLFYLEVEENAELINLQKKIVERIVTLKGACIYKDYLAPHRKYSEAQKDSLMKYGNPHVLDQFRPHITIGFVDHKKNDLNKIREIIHIEPQKFYINNIHLTVGDGDQRTIEVFKFKS